VGPESRGKFLSGFVSIIGPPNVGKSTLLNRLIGKKISIVSPKPQTTRNRILGVYHGEGYQIVFIDTPGIHRTRTPLHRSMVASAQSTFQEVDVILLMIEMPRPNSPEISPIIKKIRRLNRPVVLAINKIDLGPKEKLLPIIDQFRERYPFAAIVPISALKGDGADLLLGELKSRLTEGPAFFPKGMETDQSETFLVSEVIREKVFKNAKKELPYSSAVTVERMEEASEGGLLNISAAINVERQSQKGILVGHRGKMIRKIGQAARYDLEGIFGTRVFLDLTIRVQKNWSRDTRALRRLGY